MDLFNICVVTEDEDYIKTLEKKLINELENFALIHIITDMEYLEEYLTEYRRIDVLIIEEHIYGESFQKHEIKNVVNITSTREKQSSYNNIGREMFVYKFQGINEIYAYIDKVVTERLGIHAEIKDETRIIGMYSPIGGIGKTTTAIGIAASLSKQNKKVLYLNLDAIYTYAQLFKCTEVIEEAIITLIKKRDKKIVESLSQLIRNNHTFDYVLPFRQAIPMYGLSLEDYRFFVRCCKEHLLYDYIILDLPTQLSIVTSGMMDIADKVIILAGQDKASMYKLNYLMTQIDCSNHTHFKLWCNKYEKERKNYLETNMNLKGIITVNAYIDYCPDLEEYQLENVIREFELKDYLVDIF